MSTPRRWVRNVGVIGFGLSLTACTNTAAHAPKAAKTTTSTTCPGSTAGIKVQICGTNGGGYVKQIH